MFYFFRWRVLLSEGWEQQWGKSAEALGRLSRGDRRGVPRGDMARIGFKEAKGGAGLCDHGVYPSYGLWRNNCGASFAE